MSKQALADIAPYDIARCRLVPNARPTIESYQGIADRVNWYVYVEGPTSKDWQIMGPNRDNPQAAVDAWNEAWS